MYVCVWACERENFSIVCGKADRTGTLLLFQNDTTSGRKKSRTTTSQASIIEMSATVDFN